MVVFGLTILFCLDVCVFCVFSCAHLRKNMYLKVVLEGPVVCRLYQIFNKPQETRMGVILGMEDGAASGAFLFPHPRKSYLWRGARELEWEEGV